MRLACLKFHKVYYAFMCQSLAKQSKKAFSAKTLLEVFYQEFCLQYSVCVWHKTTRIGKQNHFLSKNLRVSWNLEAVEKKYHLDNAAVNFNVRAL